jgi:xanthine/CO dehydrogenase XdhC/CoxF family maturation factor
MLDAIRRAQAAGARAAIATVVRVRGSAYRREGTRILVREDGTYECLLSGGCLEPTVAEAAARVIATGDPVVATYDLEADSVWGLSIGCSGAVDIRIERVEDTELFRAWLTVQERGQRAALITALTGASGRILLYENGEILGALSDATLQAQAAARALQRLREHYPHAGAERFGPSEVFFEFSEPPPSLVIFGAGQDAEPLARLAWEVGFAVTVVDTREAFLTADRFPGMTLIASHFSRFPETVRLDARSFVVVMNHHLERDWESLRYALMSDAVYVGVLGPRTRFRKLLAALDEQGWRPGARALERVHSPVGLALGAETPEEIAVSIMGEIIALRRGFEGGFLSGRETTIHGFADTNLHARS